MTVLELIKGSLRLIGSLGVGRGIGASAEADCLFALNTLIGSWRTQRLLVPRLAEASYTWPANVSSRTIGAAGDFNTARPIRVETAVLIDGETRQDLELLTFERWTERNPGLYYDPAFPVGALYLWPVPDTQRTLELGTWQPITTFATTAETISLPDGYERALMYNLAPELAPQFPDAQLSQLVIDTAREAKADIKRLNVTHQVLGCDPAMMNSYAMRDWRTDYS